MRFKVPAKQPESFRASALYLSGHAKGQSPDRVDWVKGYNLETVEPTPAAAVMQATASRNRRCKNAAYHFIVSFDPKDVTGDKLTPDRLRDIADEVVTRFGLDDYQALVYSHKDTDHPHMHFLVNRVHPQKLKALSRHNDGRRLMALCQEIAEERGLNIAQSWDKDIDREISEEGFETNSAAPDDGEYWQAKREGRDLQTPMGKDEVEWLRQRLKSHFLNAQTWEDLAARLGAQGVFMQRKGQGIVLSKGERFTKLSQMGKGVRLVEMEQRFAERFDVYIARTIQSRSIGEMPREKIPNYDNMTAAERRRAERLVAAQQDVARKRGNPVCELEEADFDYRYWSGVEAIYRATERRISKLERERDWLHKIHPNFEAREKKAEDKFMSNLATVFRDPEKAKHRWHMLEKAYGIEEAERMIQNSPKLLGQMHGVNLLSQASGRRIAAERAFKHLDKQRKRWRETRLKLGHHKSRIENNRRELRLALNDFKMMRLRVDVPHSLERIIRGKILRRQKALARVTEKAIIESNLADDRKDDLIRARRKFMERRRTLERGREREF